MVVAHGREVLWAQVLDYDFFDKWLPPGEVRTTESLLGVLAAQKPALAFAPGTAFEYSSFGYDLAALAAARVARSTYAELLKARVFDPLGVTSAFVHPRVWRQDCLLSRCRDANL